MVPGLLAIVLVMPTLAMAMGLTREKETGTLEGLIATPISRFEYVTGKLVAYLSMGMVSVLLAMAVAVLWFRTPFRGSMLDYSVLAAVYLLACMSVAILIAHLSSSQQTAMFIVLLTFLVPSFFMAGVIIPVSTGSIGSMLASYALPTTHFVAVSRAVFLRGSGLSDLWAQILILLGMGLGALVLGLVLFRKKLA
jgi:ABC-2 type transport system permease protein